MMGAGAKYAAILAVTLLAACATTSEMPLSPNQVRLNTQAQGLLFTSTAGATTLKKAASATIARGFTRFRLDQAETSQGSRIVGVQSNTSGFGTANRFGNSISGTYNATTFSTPIRAPTASISVTVTMFNDGDPGSANTFVAADVLAKDGKI